MANNTHEVALAIAPGARVVYVDNDPIVLAHARALLTGTPEGSVAYVHADLRQPDKIRGATARTLDLSQPVALMMLMVVDRLLNACPRAATWPFRTRRATSWQKASPRRAVGRKNE